jgi:hypothetical protein
VFELTSPFLQKFSAKLVARLDDGGHVQLSAPREEVVDYLAAHLSGLTGGQSLISELVSALLSCPGVEEIFADDDTLKECLEDLHR